MTPAESTAAESTPAKAGPADTRPAEARLAETVGFIGVGLMGHGMAKNILEKGYPLTIMGHRNRVPIDDLVERGAREARTAREVAQQSSVVVLCVTGSPQVEALVHGPDGLASGLAAGSVVVDCSTPRRSRWRGRSGFRRSSSTR